MIISVIILHWNNFKCTDFCLDSLTKIKYEGLEIIIVDNCSTDGSFTELKQKYPQYTYLQNNENLGFARGTNAGLRYAYNKGAEYFILLNNDVEVTPNFVEKLIDPILINQTLGLVTPKILYRDKKNLIWHAGGHINKSTITGIARGYDEIDKGQYNQLVETDWASGACCLIKREVIDKIGYLEERYFFGQEEWDYSTTAIKAGFKIIYTPHSVVYHEIGQSSTKSPALYAYQNVYNKHVYASKHLAKLKFYFWATKYFFYILLFFPKKNVPNDSADDFYMAMAKKAAIWGVRDFFTNVFITSDRLKLINEKLLKLYKK